MEYYSLISGSGEAVISTFHCRLARAMVNIYLLSLKLGFDAAKST